MKQLKRMQNPLVSVIMPVYNAGGYLVEAIDSILRQTYQNFEFIIVDDNSTDGSWVIIKRYAKRYPKKIRVLRTIKTLNRGGDACANEGIKKAQGKYIARMDADDISYARRLEKQVKFLEKNKNIFLVGSNATVIDKKGRFIGEKLEPETNQEIYKAYFTFHPIIHPSTMYRKIVKGKRFYYPNKYSANNDYYVFFKMITKNACFANLQEKLIYYRIHGKNDTFYHMREKFFNTLKIRLQMVMKNGYEPTKKQWLICFAQLIAFLILPEKILTNLYLVTKGITKKEKFFEKLIFAPKQLLSHRFKKLAYS